MVLIFGGTYQGKLDYALEHFGLGKDDVYFCSDGDTKLPIDKKVIYEADKWILALIKEGVTRVARDDTNATEEDTGMAHNVKRFFSENSDAIVICNDISCGVVPIDPIMRKWRDEVGRFMAQAAKVSDEVVRLFCGIPTCLSKKADLLYSESALPQCKAAKGLS